MWTLQAGRVVLVWLTLIAVVFPLSVQAACSARQLAVGSSGSAPYSGLLYRNSFIYVQQLSFSTPQVVQGLTVYPYGSPQGQVQISAALFTFIAPNASGNGSLLAQSAVVSINNPNYGIPTSTPPVPLDLTFNSMVTVQPGNYSMAWWYVWTPAPGNNDFRLVSDSSQVQVLGIDNSTLGISFTGAAGLLPSTLAVGNSFVTGTGFMTAALIQAPCSSSSTGQNGATSAQGSGMSTAIVTGILLLLSLTLTL